MPAQPVYASSFTHLNRSTLGLLLVSLLLFNLFTAQSVLAASAEISQKNSFINTSSAQRLKQRQLYQQAQQAFNERRYSSFKQLTQQLQDYPLLPYLEYRSLTRRLDKLGDTEIKQFLKQHDNTVTGDRFRLKVIALSVRNANWQKLIDYYQPGFGVSTECQYLYALMQTGKAELAYPRIQSLWLSAHSQPRSCDRPFNAWQQAGHRSPELVWQRFKLAMSMSNRQLARYLLKSMPPADARVGKLWLELHRHPEKLNTQRYLSLSHKDRSSILLHGLKRLSYKDLDAAIASFYALKAYFNPLQTAQITRRIGLQLARDHMPEAGIWLSRVPASLADKQVNEWKIRTAIRQGDWSHVLAGIALLPLENQSNYRWQYWWAYANEQLGNENDAQGIYQYLANKRSFYGFLAADHLSQDYAFEDRPVEPGSQLLDKVNRQPEALRAYEFLAIGQQLPARREWHRLINRLNTEEKLAASKLAQSWNWHDRAIITMGKTRYRDDITLRFPLDHEDNVENWSEQHNIDPAWTFAIIRRESAFMPDARSAVGAIGLMQLMPNTARQVARQLKVRYRGRFSLTLSNTNIRLGTSYLERMLNRLDSQHVLATAAYNAGPNRVTQWLPENQQMDAIRWIETIPYTETREYVSNVLAYMAIYEHRMNRAVTPLSRRMPPVPPRNSRSADASSKPPKTAHNLLTSSPDPT